MRPLDQVHDVLKLRRTGLGARRIGRLTGIPVKTVQEWLSEPERALARPKRSGITCHGACDPWLQAPERPYSFLLGMYLGDGYIVRVGRSYRLAVYCDERYDRIIDEVGAALSRVRPNKLSIVQRVGCVAVISYSQHWPCFFPQHGPGVKHERAIVLEPWQRAIVERKPRPFLRGLIHSDGWRGNNVAIRKTDLATEYRTYTRYQFSNRSDDIRGLFCWACDLLGIHWTQANRWTISVARRKDVHYMDSFIGPKR